MSLGDRALHKAAMNSNPAYRGAVERGQSCARTGKLISMAGLVTAVALIILGAVLLTATGYGAIPLAIGLIIGVCAYDVYKSSSNLAEIMKNPPKYLSVTNQKELQEFRELTPEEQLKHVNEKRLKADLAAGTILITPVINKAYTSIRASHIPTPNAKAD